MTRATLATKNPVNQTTHLRLMEMGDLRQANGNPILYICWALNSKTKRPGPDARVWISTLCHILLPNLYVVHLQENALSFRV